jgi:hypothetical protein
MAGMVDGRERRYGSLLVGGGCCALDGAATDSDVLTQTIVLLGEI